MKKWRGYMDDFEITALKALFLAEVIAVKIWVIMHLFHLWK